MLIPESSNFATLVNYFNFAAWTFYGATIAALLWLRYTKPDMKRPYKVGNTTKSSHCPVLYPPDTGRTPNVNVHKTFNLCLVSRMSVVFPYKVFANIYYNNCWKMFRRYYQGVFRVFFYLTFTLFFLFRCFYRYQYLSFFAPYTWLWHHSTTTLYSRSTVYFLS